MASAATLAAGFEGYQGPHWKVTPGKAFLFVRHRGSRLGLGLAWEPGVDMAEIAEAAERVRRAMGKTMAMMDARVYDPAGAGKVDKEAIRAQSYEEGVRMVDEGRRYTGELPDVPVLV